MTYREHVFVCLNERAVDDPKGCCMGRGAKALFDQLRADTRGRPDIRINKSGCLNRCAEGPVMVRYPKGEWFTCATAEDCTKLAADIIADG